MTENPEGVVVAVRAGAVARPWLLLGGGLAIGFICEALLHAQPPGWGYAVAALVASVIWLAVGWRSGLRASAWGPALLGLILFYSIMVAVRASYVLQALNVLIGIWLALLMAAIYLPGGLPRMSLTDHGIALILSGLAPVYQPFLLVFGDLRRATRTRDQRRLGPVLWGIALAIPLLLVFGLLFASADAVFAGYLRQVFGWLPDFPQLVARLVLSLMLSWLVLGLMRRAFVDRGRDPALEDLINLDFLRANGATAITLLALVDALFLAFVAVQAVYLFGGADTLARSGLTHSEYARRGFFELVVVAALVLALVLFADWLTRSVEGRARQMIALLEGLLVLLTLVILASALLRMRLYEAEYGLTELRFYTTVFMAWLAIVLLLLLATVLPPRTAGGEGRRRFAFGALLSALAAIAVLDLVNPDAWIARTNLARATAETGQPLDVEYLTRRLSAGAVPATLNGLANLRDPALRQKLACALRDEAGTLAQQASRLTWRGVNWDTAVAQRALTVAQGELQAACGG